MSTSPPVLVGTESFAAIQREVCSTLADELAPIKVYDYVPEKAEAPYVVWNTAWGAERDTLNGTADRVWFQIDVWSTYRGYKEATEIADRIVRRLGHSIACLDGYSTIHLLLEQGHSTRDPDGRHRRIALTFHSPYVSPLQGAGGH